MLQHNHIINPFIIQKHQIRQGQSDYVPTEAGSSNQSYGKIQKYEL